MKKLILFLFLSPIYLFGQEAITIEEVVQIDSSSQNELFIKAKEWIASNFKDSKEVIQFEDKEAGRISCKAVYSYKGPKWWGGGTADADGYINFNLDLFFKDGKYRYVFSDFKHEPLNGKSFGTITDSDDPPMKSHLGSKKRAQLIWEDLKGKVKSNTQSLIESLVKKMKSKEEW